MIIVPAYGKNGIPIIMASDNRYVPYLSVTLASILAHTKKTKNYDIIILENNISKHNKEILLSQTNGLKNVSLRFYNLCNEIKQCKFNVVSYYSAAIYFRIFMPYIMPDYDKAIYLDCDLVLNKDIDILFDYPIENNLVGAVRDIGMILHYYTSGKEYIPKSYFTKYLSAIKPSNYFNSGVLVMNLKAFRNEIKLDDMIKIVNEKGLKFPDQDGLNIICANRVCFLPFNWNCIPQNTGNRTLENLRAELPSELFIKYISGRDNPFIIHYAMREKPWLYSTNIDYCLFVFFWKYAVKSPFWDDIIFNNKSKIVLPEKAAIIKTFKKIEPVKAKSNNNVYFVLGNYCLGDMAHSAVRYETLEIKNNMLRIECSCLCFDEEMALNSKFWFLSQGVKFPCEKIVSNEKICFGEEIISKKIVLRADITLQGVKEADIFLYTTYKGVNVKRILNNYSKLFPADKIIDEQYYANKNYLIKSKEDRITVRRVSFAGRIKQEIKYKKAIIKKFGKAGIRASIIRTCAHIKNFLRRKQVWLINDNFLTDDNGYAFFKYIRENHRKNIKAYFVYTNKTQNIQKAQKLGKCVLIGTKKYKWLFLTSDYSVGSVVYPQMKNAFSNKNDFYRDFVAKRGFVFLQHGVISQDLSKEHNKFVYNPCGFVTSANPEWESLVYGNYFYLPSEVWLTGLPRFDLLYNDSKKIITFMPTWRKYLINGLTKQSEFYKNYDKVINNEKLISACQRYGYRLNFRLHPLLQKYYDVFSNENNHFSITNDTYRELFAHSDLIITDYSSAIFDFLYLNKPIIYYQFDKEHFFKEHVYDEGYLDYEKNGFGQVCYDADALVETIISYMRNGCAMEEVYKKRLDNFFGAIDKNNSKRVYDRIINCDKGLKNEI